MNGRRPLDPQSFARFHLQRSKEPDGAVETRACNSDAFTYCLATGDVCYANRLHATIFAVLRTVVIGRCLAKRVGSPLDRSADAEGAGSPCDGQTDEGSEYRPHPGRSWHDQRGYRVHDPRSVRPENCDDDASCHGSMVHRTFMEGYDPLVRAGALRIAGLASGASSIETEDAGCVVSKCQLV